MKVLIGYDGSERAQAAIQDLHRAGLPSDVEALVLSVAEVFPPLPQSSFDPVGVEESLADDPPEVRKARALAVAAMAEARELVAEGARRVKAEFPTWRVAHEAGPDSPYGALISKSESWKPNLVVVGASGRTLVEKILLGSVAQNVLAYSPCSVRIGRPSRPTPYGAEAPNRIIIGVDGSANAAAAVSAVAQRDWPAGSEFKVITAVDTPLWVELLLGSGAAESTTNNDDNLSFARAPVESAIKELHGKNLPATAVVVEGDPKQVLVEEAKRWEADCIFLGAKGHGRLERLLLGSVSATVAARAHCSVEVVRSE